MLKNLKLLVLVLTVLLTSLSSQVKASHGAGGELVYEWISDSTYRFFFKFYRDCTGIPPGGPWVLCAVPSCTPANPLITSFATTMPLWTGTIGNGLPNGSPIGSYCPGTQTKCQNSSSTINNYEEVWYSTTITLPGRCNNWIFSVDVAARNSSNNINPSGDFFIQATFNNLLFQGNSSPVFNIRPEPNVCINMSHSYNNGTTDPNGDSVVTELVQPLYAFGACPASPSNCPFNTASPPYNITNNPFQTNNTFTLNAQTGQMSFTPAAVGAQTISFRVKEYRNGVFVGSTMRDYMTYVISCPNNAPITTTLDLSSVTNAIASGNTITLCRAPFSFCFDLKSSSTSAILKATDNHNSISSSSVLTYTNINRDSVRGCFSWSPGVADTGLKTLYITVLDSTCGAPGFLSTQTFAYAINVKASSSAPVVSSPVTYCQYKAASPLTATGQNLLWYTTATGGTGSTTAPTPNTNTPNNTTWYVSQSLPNGCESPRSSINVVVNVKPALPTVTPNYAYCFGANTTPLNATGTNLQWYTQASGGTPSTATPVPSSSTPGTFKWWVSQTISGCESDRDSITVLIAPATIPAPTAPTIVKYCEGDAPTALTATGTNLQWYTSFNGTASTTAPTPSTTVHGTFFYFVSSKIAGCESAKTTIRVEVYEKVNANIQLLPDSLCQFDTTTLDSVSATKNPSSAVYKWTFTGGGKVDGKDPGPYHLVWDSTGSHTIKLSITNESCKAADSTIIFINASPEAEFKMNNDACADEIIEIDSILQQDAYYHWTVDDNSITDSLYHATQELSWNEKGVKKVKLLLSAMNGCSSLPFTDSIAIHKPEAAIKIDNSKEKCIGDKAVLTVKDVKDQQYNWYPESLFNSNNAAEVEAKVKENIRVSVKVTDKWQCIAADSLWITVKPCCEIVLPNAFTPNKDGKNDRFGIISNGSQRIHQFIIKNRWGNTVFSTENQVDSWDGNYRGVMQDPDTYFYYIKFSCSDIIAPTEKTGTVNLIR